MATTSHARVAGLMLLVAALGFGAAVSAPDQTHIGGMWPVGLVSGVLVYVARPAVPAVAAALLLITVGTFVLADYPLGVAIGYAVGIVVEGLVTLQVLTVRWGYGRRLNDDLDLARFALAALAGSFVGATVFTVVAAVTGFGLWWAVFLATFVTHLASQLILLALFMEEFRHPGSGGPTERWLRWAVAVLVTLAAFVPTQAPGVVFFILPVIAWAALRAPMR